MLIETAEPDRDVSNPKPRQPSKGVLAIDLR